MADYNLLGFFTASKVGKAGITVTIDVYRRSTNAKVVDNVAATEIGGGFYKYTYTTAIADDYAGVFKTADTTVDFQHTPSLVPVQQPYIDEILTDTGTTIPAQITALDGKVDTIDGIVDDIFANTGTDIPAQVSAIATWTAANINSGLTAGTITQVRGSTWDITLNDVTLGDEEIWFAIKQTASNKDSEALLMIHRTVDPTTLQMLSRLVYLRGRATYPQEEGWAQLLPNHEAHTLRVVVSSQATAMLPAGRAVYGIQSLGEGYLLEPYGGAFDILVDTIRQSREDI